MPYYELGVRLWQEIEKNNLKIMKIFMTLLFSYLVFCLLFSNLSVEAKWMENVVTYSIYAPKSIAFQMYASLDHHPKWSPWLEKVVYDETSGLSEWTVSSLGLRYSWEANNTECDPPNSMQWESLNGLPNRGKVEFLSEQQSNLLQSPKQQPSVLLYENITIRLTVSYDLPSAAAIVLRSLATSFIQNTILSDLRRFDEYLQQELEKIIVLNERNEEAEESSILSREIKEL